MDHTVLAANTPHLPSPLSIHQRVPLLCVVIAAIWLQLTTHLSIMYSSNRYSIYSRILFKTCHYRMITLQLYKYTSLFIYIFKNPINITILIGWKAELAYLTYSGRFTHINGHPSAASQAQTRGSSPVRLRPTFYHVSYTTNLDLYSAALHRDVSCVIVGP